MGKKVEIYSTPTCHFCQMTKEFLQERNIPYTDYNVLADIEKRKEMIAKTGQMGVPVIVVDGQTMIGFDRDELAHLVGVSA
ncbi:NrdH-redoxin [Candidatus Kaiserbacteria bacterium RIFCSPHIGHO2_02_FULL_50_9]|uniref:NrdH-redoxin n=1 Tax=Candidatus Kaiserbacteria bacterium RIFCSPLOWO2_01_FULL_51_21 TaxID=1798508 RepID=A0A1F6ED40_9BACT|nr:MAG: NrdH-redoxin [Candidatus Kaiserbacteria bacterium RIFCSPHIGHO2_01_FULL_51_33]OGG63799.1 MAG: NrdH-redoxin [Candidatus Kaiserbacteria bacterium RIFCSPHIGHO2_02_FULL_50_9]OGG71579.1 MAG: NrdH-redoxin [Candidatus Kaiserbacteria bacterium RIFCSPLOWO2_01_FULL_51_21]